MKFLLAFITLLLTAFAAFGQTRTDSVKVYFRVGHSQVDPAFADNGMALQAFDAVLLKAMTEGTVDSLVVRGYASPEGMSDANLRLSRLRTQSVADYLVRNTGVSAKLIHSYPGGVAWDELRALVASNPDVPDRKEILNILDNVPLWIYGKEGKIIDGRKKRLMELDGGSTYQWLLRNLFPELRNSVAVAVYYTQESEPDNMDLKVEEQVETSIVEVFESTDANDPQDLKDLKDLNDLKDPNDLNDLKDFNDLNDLNDLNDHSVLSVLNMPKHHPFLMAIKTNMLYDAALVPNLGAEFYLGKRFSLYGEWLYAWWDSYSKNRFWRLYGGDLGLRWWFGRKAKSAPLSGHHIGVYGGIITFDFELGEDGYMGGKPGGTLWDRWLVNAGVEYGFSLPVAKRLNIDFSIGLGYLGGNYIKYFPFDNDYYRQKEYKMHYFGPTKAEISLVWLIGNGYVNSRKGGAR